MKDLPRLCMRQKIPCNSKATDKELFEALPLGDTWPEAELVQCFAYLYRNARLKIPASWQSTLKTFHQTLMDSVANLNN